MQGLRKVAAATSIIFMFSPLDYVPYITVYNMFAHDIWIEIAVCLRWKIYTWFIWISCPSHIFMNPRQTLHVVAKTAHEIKKCMHSSAILFYLTNTYYQRHTAFANNHKLLFFSLWIPLIALLITVDRSVEGHGRVKNPDVAARLEAGAQLVP